MGFEAYKIAVRLSLVNNVSAGIAALASQFIGLNGHIGKTSAELSLIEAKMRNVKNLVLVGGTFAAAGGAMLMSLKHPLADAMEWERETAKLRQMGLGQDQITDAQKFVTANEIIGTSMNQRLKLFTEAQGAFRESGMDGLKALEAAKVMSPVLAKYQVASEVLSGPHKQAAESAMMQMNKTVELLGGLNDSSKAAAIADGIFKAVQSSGKMVDERQLKQFIVQGGTSIAGLDHKTIFAALEPIIGEFGGSITGTGFQTAFNRTHGILSKPPRLMVNEMLRLGLWDESKLEFNSQGGIKSMHGSPMKADLAKLQETDTLAFLTRMMEIYKSKGIESIADIARENEIVFGRTGGRIYTKAMQQIDVMRHSVHAFDKAKGIDQTVNDEKNSPMMAMSNFHKAMADLGLVIGQTVLPVLTPMIQSLTSFFRWLKDYPALVRVLTVGFVALAGAMAFGGTIALMTGAFRGLGLAMQFVGGGSVLGALISNIGKLGPLIARLGLAIQFVGGSGVMGAAISGLSKLGPLLGRLGLAGAAVVAIYEIGKLGVAIKDFWQVKNREGVKLTAGMTARLEDPKNRAALDAMNADFKPRAQLPIIQNTPTTTLIDKSVDIRSSSNSVTNSVFNTKANGKSKEPDENGPLNTATEFVRSAKQQLIQVTSSIVVDGKKLAEVVTMHQAREANRPGMGAPSFDPTMGLMPVGMRSVK